MRRVRTTAVTLALVAASAACTPALDALQARRDKSDAIVPDSSARALSCVADGAAKAGARVTEQRFDPETGVSDIVLAFAPSDATGPEFHAWYEFSARDGKTTRVVYTLDAVDPHRDAARERALAPIRGCGGDAVH